MEKKVSFCWGEGKEDLGTGEAVSNTGVLSGDFSAIAELFIFPRPVFHIMVLKFMSLCAT